LIKTIIVGVIVGLLVAHLVAVPVVVVEAAAAETKILRPTAAL
jgi:hypothetical protein